MNTITKMYTTQRYYKPVYYGKSNIFQQMVYQQTLRENIP